MRWVALVLAVLTLALPSRAEGVVDCLLEPWIDVTVSAAAEGLVAEVLVKRGDLVKKGQVVARLESSVERALFTMAEISAKADGRVRRAEVQLAFSELVLARQAHLQAKEVASARDVDEAESNREIAVAELQVAREEKQVAALDLRRARAVHERRTIRSPVDGVVLEEIVLAGEWADPPQVLRIAQISPLRVEVFAPLALFGRVFVGMRAEVQPEAPIGGSYMAEVVVVDPVVDPASATFGVRLELPNLDQAIPAGLNCKVRFPLPDAAGASAPPATEPGNDQ